MTRPASYSGPRECQRCAFVHKEERDEGQCWFFCAKIELPQRWSPTRGEWKVRTEVDPRGVCDEFKEAK